MNDQEIREIFQEAFDYANENTTCLKVPVGACFLTPGGNKYFSCNHTNNGMEQNCVYNGVCYKAKITGIFESCEETRKYCSSTHAEVNMINLISNNDRIPITGSILFITRYPCQNCATKVVEAGVDTVYYCGKVKISDEVEKLFRDNDVTVIHYPDIDFEY